MNRGARLRVSALCCLVVLMVAGCAQREESPEWQLRQARLSLSRSDFQLAMLHVSKAVGLRPDDPAALVLRGEVQERQGLLSMAIDDYSRALTVAPDHLEALRRRGDLFRQLGRYEQAVADATQMIRIAPDDPDGYTQRARARRRIGQHAQARQDLQHALTMAPQDRFARRELGRHFEAVRKFNDARATYERVLTDHPRDVEAHVLLGNLAARENRIDDGLRSFRTALELDPGRGDVYYKRSFLHMAAGQYREAMDDTIRAGILGESVDQRYLSRLKRLADGTASPDAPAK